MGLSKEDIRKIVIETLKELCLYEETTGSAWGNWGRTATEKK